MDLELAFKRPEPRRGVLDHRSVALTVQVHDRAGAGALSASAGQILSTVPDSIIFGIIAITAPQHGEPSLYTGLPPGGGSKC